MTFLRSFCNKPAVAAIKAVAAPTKVTNAKTEGTHSNSGDERIIRKTPAVTMVAAWMRAETGVGKMLTEIPTEIDFSTPLITQRGGLYIQLPFQAC